MPEDLSQNHMDSVDSIEFKPASGGLVSETRGKMKSAGKGRSMIDPYKHETAIHNSLSSAVHHLKKHLSHHFSKKTEKRETMKKGG